MKRKLLLALGIVVPLLFVMLPQVHGSPGERGWGTGGLDLSAEKCTAPCLYPGDTPPKVDVTWRAAVKSFKSVPIPGSERHAVVTVRLVLPKTVTDVQIRSPRTGISRDITANFSFLLFPGPAPTTEPAATNYAKLVASYQALTAVHPAARLFFTSEPAVLWPGDITVLQSTNRVLTAERYSAVNGRPQFFTLGTTPVTVPAVWPFTSATNVINPALRTTDGKAVILLAEEMDVQVLQPSDAGIGVAIPLAQLSTLPLVEEQDSSIRNQDGVDALLRKADPDHVEFVRITRDAQGVPTVTDISGEVEAAYAAFQDWAPGAMTTSAGLTDYQWGLDGAARLRDIFGQLITEPQVRRYLRQFSEAAWLTNDISTYRKVDSQMELLAGDAAIITSLDPPIVSYPYFVHTESESDPYNYYDIALPQSEDGIAEFEFRGKVQQTEQAQVIPAQLFYLDHGVQQPGDSNWSTESLLDYSLGQGLADPNSYLPAALMRGSLAITAENNKPYGIIGNSQCKVSVPAHSAGISADKLDKYNIGTDLGFAYGNDINGTDAGPYPNYDAFKNTFQNLTGVHINWPWRFEDGCDQVAVTVPPVVPCEVPKYTFKLDKIARNCDVGLPECGLSGAQFAIYGQDPNVIVAGNPPTPIANGLTPDANGLTPDAEGKHFTSTELTPGDYWIVETQAPEGFALLAQPIKIRLAATGVEVLSGGEERVTVTTTGTGADLQSVIKVENVARIELPRTGGIGVAGYAQLGVVLVGLGLGSRYFGRRFSK